MMFLLILAVMVFIGSIGGVFFLLRGAQDSLATAKPQAALSTHRDAAEAGVQEPAILATPDSELPVMAQEIPGAKLPAMSPLAEVAGEAISSSLSAPLSRPSSVPEHPVAPGSGTSKGALAEAVLASAPVPAAQSLSLSSANGQYSQAPIDATPGVASPTALVNIQSAAPVPHESMLSLGQGQQNILQVEGMRTVLVNDLNQLQKRLKEVAATPDSGNPYWQEVAAWLSRDISDGQKYLQQLQSQVAATLVMLSDERRYLQERLAVLEGRLTTFGANNSFASLAEELRADIQQRRLRLAEVTQKESEYQRFFHETTPDISPKIAGPAS